MVVKVCMTKEMVERDQPPATSQNESGCQMKNFNRSGDAYSMETLCDSPNFKGTGTVKGSNPSKESFTPVPISRVRRTVIRPTIIRKPAAIGWPPIAAMSNRRRT